MLLATPPPAVLAVPLPSCTSTVGVRVSKPSPWGLAFRQRSLMRIVTDESGRAGTHPVGSRNPERSLGRPRARQALGRGVQRGALA